MTVPSATLEGARPDEATSPGEPMPPIADESRDPDEGDGGSGEGTVGKRRLVLVLACVAAFVVGFGGVTLIMRSADSASKSPTKTKAPVTTAAPPSSATTAPPSSATTADRPAAAPPPPAPVPEVSSGPAAAPEPSPAPAPRQESASPPPSTSVPPTNPPTTTPSTTTP